MMGLPHFSVDVQTEKALISQGFFALSYVAGN